MDYVEAIIEITGKVDDFTYPEHTYYLNKDGKLIGYKSIFTGKVEEFSKPMAFYKSRRKFKKA